MKSSKAVKIGALVGLLAASLACSDPGEETQVVQTEYGEICVRREPPPEGVDQQFMEPPQPQRVDWSECERDSGHTHFYPYYIHHGGGHSAPPVGSRIAPNSGTVVRPAAGSYAAAPPSGGFGTKTTVTAGG